MTTTQIHTMPTEDVKEHVESPFCWCAPSFDGYIWTHKVFSDRYPKEEREMH